MHYQTILLLTVALATSTQAQVIKPWLSPQYTWLFEYPLPIPSGLAPLTSYTNTTTGKSIDFYQMTIENFESQIYPTLGKASLTGYNGVSPGPTLQMTKGREAVVRFINNSQRNSSIHLHGSYSRTAFDGWAEDTIAPGQYKDYYYPNAQPQRTLWYHDHALGITAVNAYFGQAGFYILNDPVKNAQLQLPEGKYDIPLMLSAKQFQADGSLFSPATELISLYGDVILVNGQPWPYHNVEARKYRFRLLDAAVSRTFKIYMMASGAPDVRIPFTVVGADAGFLDHPVNTTDLIISMAERWEIVIDFEQYKGQNITVMNERNFQVNDDFPETDKVMRFVVGDDKSSNVGNGPLPAHLADLVLPESHPIVDKNFTFGRTAGQWTINGVTFTNVENRILANPTQGKVQRWRLTNRSNGWTHPIHVHLVDMQIVSRAGGRGVVEPYEAASLKDVIYLGRQEEVEVIADFAPWSGLYMFHCHNLVHEDHDMMAAFNVSKIDLTAWGYPESVDFGDPMSALFSAKAYTSTDINQIKDVLLPYFQNLDAYPDASAIIAALDDYHVNGPRTTSSLTTTTTTTSASTLSTSTVPVSATATVRSSSLTSTRTSTTRTTTTTTRRSTTTTTRRSTTTTRATTTRRN